MGVIDQINDMRAMLTKQVDLSAILRRMSLRDGFPKKLPQFRSTDKCSSPRRKFKNRSNANNPFSASCESIVASLSSPRKLIQEKKPLSPKKNSNEINMTFNLAGRTFNRTLKFNDHPDSPAKSTRFNLPKCDSFDFDITSSDSDDSKVNY